MFLIPKSKIQIGAISLGENSGVESVEITDSVKELITRAVIKLPRNFVKKDNKGILDVIHVGDAVKIFLGYVKPVNVAGVDNTLKLEFSGYVSKISDTTPVVVECENEWYPYKQQMLQPKNFDSTLKNLLQYCMPGFVIDCPDVKLKYSIDKVSKYTAIESIRQSVGFFSRIDTKTLRCYYPFDFKVFSVHDYVFGTRDEDALNSLRRQRLTPNVRASALKFERKDVPMKLTAISKLKTGKDISVVVGSNDNNAKEVKQTFYNLTQSDLKAEAEKVYKKLNYNGYSGTITGYGYPQTKAGDSLKITDPDNPERNGEYLIEQVKTTYAVGKGFLRVNTISYKIK